MTARTYDELFEQPRHLTLEQESDQWWTVTSGDEVMMRADRALCERFIHAFVAKEPGASFDRAEHSWRVAQSTLSERGATESGHNGAPTVGSPLSGQRSDSQTSHPAMLPPRSDNVFPIRRRPLEPIDEVTAS